MKTIGEDIGEYSNVIESSYTDSAGYFSTIKKRD